MLLQRCGAELPIGFDTCNNQALCEEKHESCLWAYCAYGDMDNEVLRSVVKAKIPLILKRMTLE